MFYIACIDREISDCRWRISFIRTSLLAVLVALSSLFWTIASTIRDQQLTLGAIGEIAPYVVSVLSFAMAASALYSIYFTKYEPIEMPGDKKDYLEAVPHVLALIVIVVVAAVASIISIGRSIQSHFNSAVGLAYFMTFAFAFVLYLIMAYILAASTRKPRNSSATKTPLPSKVPRGPMSIGRILYITTAIYLIVGFFALCLAWHLNERALYFLLAAQGSGALVLVYFALERVGALMDESFNISSLREERSIAVHQELRDTEFGGRYLGLATVDVQLRNSDKQ